MLKHYYEVRGTSHERTRPEINVQSLFSRLAQRASAAGYKMSLGEALFEMCTLAVMRPSDLARLDFERSVFECHDGSAVAFADTARSRGRVVVAMRLAIRQAKNARLGETLSTPIAVSRTATSICVVRWMWAYCRRRAALATPAGVAARHDFVPVFVYESSFNSQKVEGFYSSQAISHKIKAVVQDLDSSVNSFTIADLRSASISSVLAARPDQVRAVQRLARWRSSRVMQQHYDRGVAVSTARLVNMHFLGSS